MVSKKQDILLVDNRVKSWFWLYNSFVDNPKWDIYNKMVYAVLSCSSDGGSKSIEMSCKEISRKVGCSVRKVRLVIDELVCCGAIDMSSGEIANKFRVIQNNKVTGGLECGYWFWCDKYLFKRDDLDIYEKMVYLVLIRHADGKNKRAVVSYSVIAKGASCSRRKAIYVISSLINKGLLEESLPTQKGNVYLISNVLSDGEHQQNITANSLVHDVHGDAWCAPVHHIPLGVAQGAPCYPHVVQDKHTDDAQDAPAKSMVVQDMQVNPAPGAPIQETNTLCMEEQKQAFKLLLNHGITEAVAFRYSKLGYNVVQNVILQAREKERSGLIEKSIQHYIVGLLKTNERDINPDMFTSHEQLKDNPSYEDRLFIKHKIRETVKLKSL